MNNEKADMLRAQHENEDHTWVTGGDAAITHKSLIDEGAVGQVHHVTPIVEFANQGAI